MGKVKRTSKDSKWKRWKKTKPYRFTLMLVAVYLFLFSVDLLKEVASNTSGNFVDQLFTWIDDPLSSFSIGWLAAILLQSASITAIVINVLLGTGVIDLQQAFYLFLGLVLGNAATPILASFIVKHDNHWNLRHGFELGLASIIYSALLIPIVFLLQLTTGVFTWTAEVTAEFLKTIPLFTSFPDLLHTILWPAYFITQIKHWPLILILALDLFLLIVSMNLFSKAMVQVLGGKNRARKKLEKHLKSEWETFGRGLGLTILIPSSSLLITLIVPLAVEGLITLRQAIPFIIGTSVGTFLDVLLAAIATGKPEAIAGAVMLMLISCVGIVFLPKKKGTKLIHRLTRTVTMEGIPVKKRNILLFLVVYLLIPTTLFLAAKVI